eukprot:751404-Hanusia_phi.AAC.6
MQREEPRRREEWKRQVCAANEQVTLFPFPSGTEGSMVFQCGSEEGEQVQKGYIIFHPQLSKIFVFFLKHTVNKARPRASLVSCHLIRIFFVGVDISLQNRIDACITLS